MVIVLSLMMSWSPASVKADLSYHGYQNNMGDSGMCTRPLSYARSLVRFRQENSFVKFRRI